MRNLHKYRNECVVDNSCWNGIVIFIKNQPMEEGISKG